MVTIINLIEDVQKVREKYLSNFFVGLIFRSSCIKDRGTSAKVMHVLCITQKSAHPVQARCSNLRRLELLGYFFPPFEHALIDRKSECFLAIHFLSF
jgi:hypothetical protein